MLDAPAFCAVGLPRRPGVGGTTLDAVQIAG